LDLSLREVISKGKQSVNNALKSKKGEIMTSVRIILVFPLWYPAIPYLGSHYTTYGCHGPWCSIIPIPHTVVMVTTYCRHGPWCSLHYVLLPA